jgi:hypothetical protein
MFTSVCIVLHGRSVIFKNDILVCPGTIIYAFDLAWLQTSGTQRQAALAPARSLVEALVLVLLFRAYTWVLEEVILCVKKRKHTQWLLNGSSYHMSGSRVFKGTLIGC